MAAIQGTRVSSSVGGLFAIVAVAAALLIGGGAGYAVKGITSPGAAPAGEVVQQHAVNAVEMPAWVEKYVTPAQAPQFKVDEYLESLSYMKAAEAPAWAGYDVHEFLGDTKAAAPAVDNEQLGFTQQ